MSTLDKVTLNSVNLIDERLRLLQEELKEIESQFRPLELEKPLEFKSRAQRYQDLPKIQPDAGKNISIKPQISDDYLRTLQYAPDIMSEYLQSVREPQYLNESIDLITPPRNLIDNSLLFDYLSQKTKEIR